MDWVVAMRLLILALVLGMAAAPATVGAQAAIPSIPASLYPAGSHLTFSAQYSDASMNEAWNFDAAGEPLMHTYPQSVFLRQSGWMEQSFLQHGKQIAWFILFDSSYGTFASGAHGNVEAYLDLRLMLGKWWHAGLATYQPAGLLPAGSAGADETRIIPKLDDGPFVVTSVWWGDAREVEAIAFSTPHLLNRTRLREMLAAQVRYAVNLGTG